MRIRWAARTLTTVTALVVLVASIIGAYGHAAAHNFSSSISEPLSQVGSDHSHSQSEHATGQEHQGDDHANCLDTLCHGGYAIVASFLTMFNSLHGLYVVAAPDLYHGSAPTCLDRPPKISVFA